MPIVHIFLKRGRSKQMKHLLMKNITEALSNTLDVKPDQVRIILQEVPRDSWGVGSDFVKPKI